MKLYNFDMSYKIPTTMEAEQFITMVRCTPVITGGRTYDEFCEYIRHDFIGEIIDYAHIFDTRLLYRMVERILSENEDVRKDYNTMIEYWKRHGIELDNIKNRWIIIGNTCYRWDSETNTLHMRGVDEDENTYRESRDERV